MSEKDLICPICGEPTFLVYGKNPRKDRLCKKHGEMANFGELKQCLDCGKWHETDKECECKMPQKAEKPIEEQEIQESKKCLLCKNESGDYIFCKSCFAKYRNKTLLLKITVAKNQELELLDESYEGVYPCNDGHIVKSISEQTIDNYLYRNAIFHGYEYPLDIGIDKEPLKPDFCLKNYLGEGKDVYLEYFGMEGDPEYDKKTAYKMDIYRKKKITLICLYRKTDGNNLEWNLQQKLNKENLKEGKIHYEKT